MPTSEDRFLGCLYGLAVGDALGAPVEAKDHEHCKRYVENCVRPKDFRQVSRRHHGVRYGFGQVTDDTQLSLLLVKSILDKSGFDPDHYAKLLAFAFSQNIIVGGGGTTAAAARRISEGTCWMESGALPPAAGNGSAMRAAPIGLLHYKDITKGFVDDAINQGICTHNNPSCSAGSLIIARTVQWGFLGQDPLHPNRGWDLNGILQWVDKDFSEGVLDVFEWCRLGKEEALEKIAPEVTVSDTGRRWDRISPHVVPSVMWALYSFLRSPYDFWETMCTAIWPGGDVDSTAAMAGAISGAFNGLQAIPGFVMGALHDRETPLEDLLGRLATNLHQLVEGDSA